MVRLGVMLCRKVRSHGSFVDKLRVHVSGGAGGNGQPKFGGHGGRGGNVYVVGKEDTTLLQLRKVYPTKRFKAGSGGHSRHFIQYDRDVILNTIFGGAAKGVDIARSMCVSGVTGMSGRREALLGEPGQDVEIKVPTGVTVVTDMARVLGEVNQPGDRVLVAMGGAGGTRENQWRGEKGHAYSVRLDLKLLADIGLVGFPNAGKSTLLSAVSRAAPKIASYPFTTIRPQLGIMQYEDKRQISMADLPGLIEGAHINVGMGHGFLKHVERTKMLLFMVDIHGFRLGIKHPHRTAFETIALLNKELELYKEELVNKPALLALNKLDLPGAEDHLHQVTDMLHNMHESVQSLDPALRPKRMIKFEEIHPISAKERTGTEELKARLRELLDLHAEEDTDERTEKATFVTSRQLREQFPGRQLV